MMNKPYNRLVIPAWRRCPRYNRKHCDRVLTARFCLLRAIYYNIDNRLLAAAAFGMCGRSFISKNRASALVLIGGYAFLGGNPHDGLLRYLASRRAGKTTVVKGPPPFMRRARALFPDAKEGMRWEMSKPEQFNLRELSRLAHTLPEGVCLHIMNHRIFELCWREEWSKSLCGTAMGGGWKRFARRGYGVVAMKDGQVIGGASSLCWDGSGIEVRVDTREDYRGLGIAKACGAKLVLMSLCRLLSLHWESENEASRHVARALGFLDERDVPVLILNDQ